MKKKEKNIYKKYHYLIILFLTALSAVMMYPMVWTILTSFKSNAEIRINRTKFFPEEWTIEGYISAFYRPVAFKQPFCHLLRDSGGNPYQYINGICICKI